MKRLLFISTTFISCREDQQPLFYSVNLETKYKNFNSNTIYCNTEQELNRINEYMANIQPIDPCNWITIRDESGSKQSGYLRSYRKSSSHSKCK